MTPIDPERLRIALAALAGATVYGVFTLVTLFMTGAQVSRLDIVRALINVVAAAVCGVITAVIISPLVAAAIPWDHLRHMPTISFVVGAVTWEVLPFAIKGLRNRGQAEADKQKGGGA